MIIFGWLNNCVLCWLLFLSLISVILQIITLKWLTPINNPTQ